jgi:hypothetical protein
LLPTLLIQIRKQEIGVSMWILNIEKNLFDYSIFYRILSHKKIHRQASRQICATRINLPFKYANEGNSINWSESQWDVGSQDYHVLVSLTHKFGLLGLSYSHAWQTKFPKGLVQHHLKTTKTKE